jgi:hypothetical protein
MESFISLNKFLDVYNFAVRHLKSHGIAEKLAMTFDARKVYEKLLSRFHFYFHRVILMNTLHEGGTRWRSWLRHCITTWHVAGSIPDGVVIR